MAMITFGHVKLSALGMKIFLLILLCMIAASCSKTENSETGSPNKNMINSKTELVNDNKKIAALWYEAFSTKDAAILDSILSESWVDIPSPPGMEPGPAGVKPLLTQLTTTFPDLKLTIEDIMQDGNKVVVRAMMEGTQKEAFMGFPAKNRKMNIQVVDIHEIKDGKIARTWHTEDWMTGLRQLGVFEK